MRNIYPDLMIKMLSGNNQKIYFFQISAVCIGVCAYRHTTLMVVEIVDSFLGQARYTGNMLLLTKNRRSKFFYYFCRKRGFASIVI